MSQTAKESAPVRFTLDGKSVEARPGETVLNVAKREGVDIPTLCHHDAVSPYGACRLCVVEVFWGKRSKMVTSCIYTPYEDDAVKTNTERVRRTRSMVLELLLARCPGVEVLQNLGREYGVEKPRFRARKDSESSATERCILCGLCVRVCDEVVGQHAIGYASRGVERAVCTPYRDQSEECIGCGACVFICPTQALHYEDIGGQRRMVELNTSLPLVACRVCGRPFATEKQIAKVRERLAIPEGMAETCPSCRSVEFQETMCQALSLAGNSRGETKSPARSGAPADLSGATIGRKRGNEDDL
jgi:NADH dehydrogenase/NADH:ubiquinone oxidoreductase subunit G